MEEYVEPEVEVIALEGGDVIATSEPTYPEMPIGNNG